MSDIRDLSINLLAAGAAFLLGTGLRAGVHQFRVMRAKKFWGRSGVGDNFLVLGSFRRWTRFEPTGLIGTGDTHAVQELTKLFARLDADFRMSYADTLGDGDSEQNLILLGSEDVNGLVERVQKKIRSSFSITSVRTDSTIQAKFVSPDHTPTLRLQDRATGRTYSPSWEGRSEDPTGDQVVVNYGTIIRTMSPFKQGRTIVILAGIYGYGTWAGARLIADDDFQRRCLELGAYNVECLYRVDVLNNRIISIHVMELRALRGDWDQDYHIDVRESAADSNADL